MKERPIIFSAEMVRAILDGRKTQTRRVLKKQPLGILNYAPDSVTAYFDSKFLTCPYGVPGDRLWVRETTGINMLKGGRHFGERIYKATQSIDPDYSIKWIPSIHMPRWASRILLEIVSVRVERLQYISGAECDAEGIVPKNDPNWHLDLVGGVQTEIRVIREAFADKWDKINGKKHPWASNPWVWVLEFKRVEA